MCKRFLLCSVTFLLSGIIFVLCFAGVEASAESIIYEQMSSEDTRALLGDRFPFNYTVEGVSGSDYFVYRGSYGGPTLINIDDNPCFTTGNQNFNYQNGRWIFYWSESDHYAFVNKSVSISLDLSIYASDGSLFYGCFGLPISTSVYQNPLGSENSISSYPGNSINSSSLRAPAFGDAAANQDFYNTSSFTTFLWNNNTANFNMRLFTYSGVSSVTSLHAEGVTFPNQRILLAVYCPYVYGNLSASAPAETTTGNSGGQTIINNNVDLTETHSILGGISNFLSDIWESIRGIPGSILQGLQGIFVPSEGFMDEQLAELQDSFAWYDDIKKLGSDFRDAFENQSNVSAPVISIPSMSSQGHSYTERSEIVLDLSDYQEAVLSVRIILSVLLWIFFLWRLYCRLPDIIHGGGMIIGDGSRIMDELDNRETQAVFNDIESHANAIFHGSMPDITFSDDSSKIDWRV